MKVYKKILNTRYKPITEFQELKGNTSNLILIIQKSLSMSSKEICGNGTWRATKIRDDMIKLNNVITTKEYIIIFLSDNIKHCRISPKVREIKYTVKLTDSFYKFSAKVSKIVAELKKLGSQ